jgi:hypothetical protein
VVDGSPKLISGQVDYLLTCSGNKANLPATQKGSVTSRFLSEIERSLSPGGVARSNIGWFSDGSFRLKHPSSNPGPALKKLDFDFMAAVLFVAAGCFELVNQPLH